jgi:hypothetical protein
MIERAGNHDGFEFVVGFHYRSALGFGESELDEQGLDRGLALGVRRVAFAVVEDRARAIGEPDLRKEGV